MTLKRWRGSACEGFALNAGEPQFDPRTWLRKARHSVAHLWCQHGGGKTGGSWGSTASQPAEAICWVPDKQETVSGGKKIGWSVSNNTQPCLPVSTHTHMNTPTGPGGQSLSTLQKKSKSGGWRDTILQDPHGSEQLSLTPRSTPSHRHTLRPSTNAHKVKISFRWKKLWQNTADRVVSHPQWVTVQCDIGQDKPAWQENHQWLQAVRTEHL